jgi:integrase
MATGKRTARGGLFKRGDIWWVWVRGKRYSTKCRDRKAALIVKAQLERAAVDPVYLASHSQTVGGAVKAFLEHYETRGRADASLTFYRVKTGHLVRVFGAKEKLANVTAPAVDRFVRTRLDEGAARNTVSKELTALRQVLKLAKRHGSYGADIAAVMPLGFAAEYKPKRRALTWDELIALVPEIARFREAHAGMVVFFVATACRKSEAERARGEDIDWANWNVHVRGQKTEAADDEVPIAPPFRPLLAQWVPEATGELFGVWHNMTRDLAAACVRAGIERVTANDLRRSNATLLRRAGASVDVLARVLRHADSRMVERVYGRISASDAGRLLASQMAAQLPSKTSTAEADEEENQGVRGQNRTADTRIFNPYAAYEDPPGSGAFVARVPRRAGYSAAVLAHSLSTVGGAP